MIGDGYTPLGGGGQSQPGGQIGAPTYYTQSPRDYLSSLIVADTTLGDSSWTPISAFQGPSYIELTEVLIYSLQDSACIFAVAIVPLSKVPFFLTSFGSPLNQSYVVYVQSVPAGLNTGGGYLNGSIRSALSTGVYQDEELFVWSNGIVNYRISGKVATQ